MLEAFRDDDVFVDSRIRRWLKWDEESLSFVWRTPGVPLRDEDFKEAVREVQRGFPDLFPDPP